MHQQMCMAGTDESVQNKGNHTGGDVFSVFGFGSFILSWHSRGSGAGRMGLPDRLWKVIFPVDMCFCHRSRLT